MKNYILLVSKYLIIILLLLTGCAKDADECSCDKNYHELVTTTYWENGLPHLWVEDQIVASEKVVCQDEQTTNTGDSTYFEIICN